MGGLTNWFITCREISNFLRFNQIKRKKEWFFYKIESYIQFFFGLGHLLHSLTLGHIYIKRNDLPISFLFTVLIVEVIDISFINLTSKIWCASGASPIDLAHVSWLLTSRHFFLKLYSWIYNLWIWFDCEFSSCHEIEF